MKNNSRKFRTCKVPAIIWIIMGLVVIALASLVANMILQAKAPPAIIRSEGDVPRISVQDTYEALTNGQAVLLDTRSLDSYQQGHATGAVSLPVDEVETRLGELDKDQWYITYCT